MANNRLESKREKLSPPEYLSMKVSELVRLYREKKLNLEPAFQRSSVWKPAQRWKLLDTIFRGYPIPAIFLVERREKRKIIYDVIDGKQRLETIFLFMKLMPGRKTENGYSALLTDLDSASTDSPKRRLAWRQLKANGDERCRLLTQFKIPINLISADWPLADEQQVFIRINSTGTPLSRGELYNAKFLKGNLLRICTETANGLKKKFRDFDVFSEQAIIRKEHVDFIVQLVISILEKRPIDKRKGNEMALEKDLYKISDIRKASLKAKNAIQILTRKLLPKNETRFNHVSDFYSLAELIAELDDVVALADDRGIKHARAALVEFSTRIDEAYEVWRSGGSLGRDKEIRDYINSVRANSDGRNERLTRHDTLKKYIKDCFPRKDPKRWFSSEQKRIGYARSTKRCSRCGRSLTFAEFSADHKKPWSKGGRTTLRNEDILCHSCNSTKGNRTR